MTSRSSFAVDTRISTDLGVGAVRNVVLRGGEVTAVVFFPDSSRDKGIPDVDRNWRVVAVHKAEVIEE